ncbi:hypothetical protein [Streptomyces sp. NBC_00069]|uniref:hypothetical protein n=1 Tax=Streptomyces sp. NBC_00069 TaxID=2975639 RepID=UPI00324497E3
MPNDIYNAARYVAGSPEAKQADRISQNRWGNSAQASYYNGAVGQLSSVPRYAMPANDDFMSYWDFYEDCYAFAAQESARVRREAQIRESIRYVDDEPYTETIDMAHVNASYLDFSESWGELSEAGVPEKQKEHATPGKLVNLVESAGGGVSRRWTPAEVIAAVNDGRVSSVREAFELLGDLAPVS